jgi:hypothetical protein
VYPLSDQTPLNNETLTANFRGRPALATNNMKDVQKLSSLPRFPFICNSLAYDKNILIVEHFDRTFEEHTRSLVDNKDALLTLLRCIADGISFLQQHGIPLFEISPETIFVSASGHPKISPLWIKYTALSRAQVKRIDRGVTFSNFRDSIDQKENVFNFGRMVYKLLYGTEFKDIKSIPDDEVGSLLRLILHDNPEQRPTFPAISARLRKKKRSEGIYQDAFLARR